jgi:hypothetical protein
MVAVVVSGSRYVFFALRFFRGSRGVAACVALRFFWFTQRRDDATVRYVFFALRFFLVHATTQRSNGTPRFWSGASNVANLCVFASLREPPTT